jgi:CRP/FNR family cyclic AMP-dependent transcriptional regulator
VSDSRTPQHRRDPAGSPTPWPPHWAASDGSGPFNAGAWSSVRLLDVEPDLASGLSEADRTNAARVVVRALDVAPGHWSPPEALHDAMALLLVAGHLTRAGRTFARPDIQLLGPGDVAEGRALSRPQDEWRALGPARLAVLDERFVLASRRWPRLMTGFARRLLEAQEQVHTRAAISAMPRVEDRILALLSHLADRWGQVTVEGVTLTLPVTHQVLGALIGARRPTVSLALLALDQQRLLRRREDRTWLLPANSVDWPTTGLPSTGPGRAA